MVDIRPLMDTVLSHLDDASLARFYSGLSRKGLDRMFLERPDSRLNLPIRFGVSSEVSNREISPSLFHYLGCNDFVVDSNQGIESLKDRLSKVTDFHGLLKRNGVNGQRTIVEIDSVVGDMRYCENGEKFVDDFSYQGRLVRELNDFPNIYSLGFSSLSGKEDLGDLVERNFGYLVTSKRSDEGIYVDVRGMDIDELRLVTEVGEQYGIRGVVVGDNGDYREILRELQPHIANPDIDVYVAGVKSAEEAMRYLSIGSDGLRGVNGVWMYTLNPREFSKLNDLYNR